MMRRLRSAAGALALCVLLAVTASRYHRRDAGQCAPAVGTGVCYVLQPMRPLSPCPFVVSSYMCVCSAAASGRAYEHTLSLARARSRTLSLSVRLRVYLLVCVLLYTCICACVCVRVCGAAALLGEYDGGGKMSKGLGVQAHDLGWDGGQDYRSSGVTYSRLAVSGAPAASVQASQPEWEDLTSAPPAYSNGVPAYSNSVAAYANLPGAPTSGDVPASADADSDSWFPNWDELTSSRPAERPASSAAPIASSGGAAEGLHSAIDTGLKAAWDSLAGVVRVHGCDAACLKDIYRRAFRAHSTHQAHSPAHAGPTEQERVAERDRKLFGQVPSEVDVSPSSFSDAYRDVSSIGVTAAPKVLGILADYLPQAASAEKQLARAIAQVCQPLFPASARRGARLRQGAK